jgi:hypothetical protein
MKTEAPSQIAVGRRRKSVGEGKDRDLVDRRLGDHLQGDPGRVRRDDDGVLAFHRVVALDALFGVVAGLTFLDDDLDTADAAVTLVEHRHVINKPVGDRNS